MNSDNTPIRWSSALTASNNVTRFNDANSKKGKAKNTGGLGCLFAVAFIVLFAIAFYFAMFENVEFFRTIMGL